MVYGRRALRAVFCLLAVSVLCFAIGASVCASDVELTSLEFEVFDGDQQNPPDQATAGDPVQVLVNVQNTSGVPLDRAIEIGFFFTEEYTRRHNLIGTATVMPLATDEPLRPGVVWDTTSLNPGLYKLIAIVMDDPAVAAENRTLIEAPDVYAYDYLKIIAAGEARVWPPETVFTGDTMVDLCSTTWDEGGSLMVGLLTELWNLGAESISRANLTITGFAELVGSDQGARIVENAVLVPSVAIDTGQKGKLTLTLRLEEFIDVVFEELLTDEPIELGSPLPIRLGLTFATSTTPGPLESFSIYLPPETDPQAGTAGAYVSLFTDIEEWTFPHACAAEADATMSIGAVNLAPVPEPGLRGRVCVVSDATIFLIKNSGDLLDSRSFSSAITSRPTIGYGFTGFTEHPIFYFVTADGLLHSLAAPDGFSDVGEGPAIEVPTADSPAGNADAPPVSRAAILPIPYEEDPDTGSSVSDSDQPATQYVIVGSGAGLHVYRADGSLYTSYEGYSVDTRFAPRAVSDSEAATADVVFFFGTNATTDEYGLYAVDVAENVESGDLALLLDSPATTEMVLGEIERPIGGDRKDAYLLFGTEDGTLYAVNVREGKTVTRTGDIQEYALGTQPLGLQVVEHVREDDGVQSLRVYANGADRRVYLVTLGYNASVRLYLGDDPAIADDADIWKPRLSNLNPLERPLEILGPGKAGSGSPGLLLLSYGSAGPPASAGPLAVFDLDDPTELVSVLVWGQTQTDFLLSSSGVFTSPVVSIAPAGYRLVVGESRLDGQGAVYAFDLKDRVVSAGGAAASEGDPVDP